MKKIILSIVTLLCGIYLGACADTAVAAQGNPLNFNSGYYSASILVDEDTGVNYIVVRGSSNGGGSCTITPRLNADGSLYVSEKKVSYSYEQE